eukprot:TRINITY_DN420_c0_g1_i2.p1 TRINITY_DN420_c0_g1~~TRINITY_DN420_c0_g1_i2.p1  ORF type:complete len:201 (-),score=66.07 TRINITY_DN420_c0_g1_i2:61-663(-)
MSNGWDIGDNATDFTAEAVNAKGEFEDITLSKLRGKYVVLLFYPLDFTFVCPSELVGFSDNYSKFQEAGADILGISVDSKFTHLAWTNTSRKDGGLGGPLNFPLVSDLTHQISKDYRVYWEKSGYSKRGLVIISDKGVVRSRVINDDPVGRSWEETLRVIQAFKHNDTNPNEVCPLGWTKGSKVIIANPKDKLSYFNSVN